MALFDYHLCDNCGERKTFYDAHMNFAFVNGHRRYDYSKGGTDYTPFPGYRVFALCHQCDETHEIVIRPKAGAKENGDAE